MAVKGLSRADEIFKISFFWSQSAPDWLQTQFDEFWAKKSFFPFHFNPLTAITVRGAIHERRYSSLAVKGLRGISTFLLETGTGQTGKSYFAKREREHNKANKEVFDWLLKTIKMLRLQ